MGPSVPPRQQILRRRRQVLELLVALVVVSLAIGALPGLHLLWVMTAVAAVLLGGYVGLLIQLRGVASSDRPRRLATGRQLGSPEVEPERSMSFVPNAEEGRLLRRSASP
jgi:hypothetical protein